MKNSLNLIHKIVKNTVSYDLVGTKPMSNDETKKWFEENKRKQKEWEDSHPEEVKSRRVWFEKYLSKTPYTPSPEEREIIKEVLNMNDAVLDTMDIYIFNDGEICVRSPQFTWNSLCGREWSVNLKERKSSLICMS